MRVAFDSNVVTYFLQANRDGYDPVSDPDSDLSVQKVAAFRLWLYTDNPAVVPTVAKEVEQISDPVAHQAHFVWTAYHLHEVLPSWLDAQRLDARADAFSSHHAGESDCRIVAECEQARVDALATFDSRLINNLNPRANILIATPEECWQRAKIPHGATQTVRLLPDHPLARATWWHW